MVILNDSEVKIKDDIYWIGGDDRTASIFEGSFPLPEGVSYNSYIILDEKTCLLDTCDISISSKFWKNLRHALNGRQLDYLVINHMEPDHGAAIVQVLDTYPDVTVVGNSKTFDMLDNFYQLQPKNKLEVKEYDAENLAEAEASGRAYTYDEDYIYLERATAVTNSISVSGAVTVDDHGLELISQTDIPVTVEMLYGNNLKNKLERNVLTISQQTLTTSEKAQARANIDAASASVVGSMISNVELTGSKTAASGTNTNLINIVLDKGVYIINAAASFSANGSGLRQIYLSYSNAGSLINRFAVFQNSPTSSGSASRISLTTILDITADNTTVYLVGLQTSGSSLTVDGIGIQAARLK